MRIIDQHHIQIHDQRIAVHTRLHATPPPLMSTPIDRANLNLLIGELLGTHGQIVIYGMPGCGKSTAVQQYAHHQTLPGGVLWVHVGANFSAITSYSTMVDWMLSALDIERLPVGYEVNSSHLQAVLALLPPCLVVFDDVHNQHDIDELRASVPAHAQVLVTTRHQHVVNDLGWPTVQVPPFEPVQALALLAFMLECPADLIHDWQWCHDLVAAVAFHPLAIRLIGRYLRQQSTQPHDWQTLADRIIHELPIDPWQELLENDAVSTGIQPLLARSFAVLTPMERQILYSIALCAPAHDISMPFLAHLWDVTPERMQHTMRKLIALSLVEPGYMMESWRQHILLRTYTLLQMGLHDATSAVRNIVIARTQSWLTHHINAYTYGQMHDDYRHIEYIFGQALVYQPADALMIADAMSQYHHAMGKYYEQLSWSNQLLHVIQTDAHLDLLPSAQMIVAMDNIAVGIHTGEHRTQYFKRGYELYRSIYRSLHDHTDTPTLNPAMANQFGIALQEYSTLPNVNRLQILDDAVALYAHIRTIPGIDTSLYVSICQNYANTLTMRAEYHYPNGTHDFTAAIAACDEGLQWLPKTATKYHFIGLHMTKSSIYQQFSANAVDRQAELLLAAADASSDALNYLDEHDDPQRYAQFMMNRANLYASLRDLLDVDHPKYLQYAMECIHEALKYRTEDRVALEYSWTQHCHADVLRQFATLPGVNRHAMLRDAIAANAEALRFRTKTHVPEDYMRTQYQQAELDRDFADISAHDQRIETLMHGLGACDEVLEICDHYADFWRADICDIKSSLLARLADALPDAASTYVFAARDANELAISLYTEADYAHLAEAWLNRMHIEHVAYKHGVDGAHALANMINAAQIVYAYRTHTTIYPPLQAKLSVEIANVILSLPHDQRPPHIDLHLLAHTGLDVATRLRHEPLQRAAEHALRHIP